jgi:hypothetical protein
LSLRPLSELRVVSTAHAQRERLLALDPDGETLLEIRDHPCWMKRRPTCNLTPWRAKLGAKREKQ